MVATSAPQRKNNPPDSQTRLDTLRASVADRGFTLTITDESIANIAGVGFRGDSLPLALVASNILLNEQPVSLRGLMYRTVSAGWLPDTGRKSYSKVSRIMVRLREAGVIPFSWIIDGVRSTIKPSSWSGLADFTETVQSAYRKDFWASLPTYVHVLCEKDSLSGVLAPITEEYDVRLTPIRGYCSLSLEHDIATTWSRIDKPIHAYYLGDFDPSGFDLERDIRKKLERYCESDFVFHRLGVNADDFEAFDLLPLAVKDTDTRAKAFRARYGSDCAELDALPSVELRRRVREAIESHIDRDQWERLKEIEAAEQESFRAIMGQLEGRK